MWFFYSFGCDGAPPPSLRRSAPSLYARGFAASPGSTPSRSAFEQQRARIFDQLLDPHEELHGLAAVDDAVVVGERRYIIGRITTWPLTATGRSWILCRPRMPTCGGLRIGVLSSEPKTPPLVMVNVPPAQVLERQRAVVGSLARSRGSPCSICGERHAVGVAQHRHDQPALGARRRCRCRSSA